MLTKFSQRYRCGSFRHAKSRVGTGLISTAHVNIRLPRLEMRMTARLIHRENRSKAGVAPSSRSHHRISFLICDAHRKRSIYRGLIK